MYSDHVQFIKLIEERARRVETQEQVIYTIIDNTEARKIVTKDCLVGSKILYTINKVFLGVLRGYLIKRVFFREMFYDKMNIFLLRDVIFFNVLFTQVQSKIAAKIWVMPDRA